MSAYVLANVEVHDPLAYTEYTRQVPASLAPFGGRFLVRAGETTTREGNWTPHRVVVIEFPDRAAAEAWYESAAYQAILPIRQRTSTAHLFAILDGVG